MTVVRALTALSLLLVVFAISSCGTSEANGKVVKARGERAVELIESDRYVVLDLRTPREFTAGRVVGAENLPAGAADLETRVAALDPRGRYLVYARNANQSGPVAERLVDLGLQRVVDAGAFGMLAIAGAAVTEGG